MLDRVLRGETDEPVVAAECCGNPEKCQVAAGTESAVAGQSRHRALNHPPTTP